MAPAFLAWRVRSIASAVALDPVPAMTWSAAAGRLDDDLDHAPVLLVAEGRRLAGGAARHDAVRALRHVHLDELPELGLVDLAAAERRDERDDGTLEHGAHSETLHGSVLSGRERRVTLALEPEALQESCDPIRQAPLQARMDAVL